MVEPFDLKGPPPTEAFGQIVRPHVIERPLVLNQDPYSTTSQPWHAAWKMPSHRQEGSAIVSDESRFTEDCARRPKRRRVCGTVTESASAALAAADPTMVRTNRLTVQRSMVKRALSAAAIVIIVATVGRFVATAAPAQALPWTGTVGCSTKISMVAGRFSP